MSSSILVNGNQRSELVIFVSKEKRHGSIMASVPANKENVSPEKEIECLSESFEKNLSMISSQKENDGRYFLDLVEKETDRFTRLCHIAEQEMTANTIPEDACGKIRAATGKAMLLVNKKFKQFKGLCDMNLGIGETNGRRPTNADLAGFWDMVMIQVDDVNNMFSNIDELRKNGWIQTQQPKDETDSSKRSSLTRQSSLSRQSSLGKGSVRRQKSIEEVKATEAEQRAAARQRLAAAKRAARQRMQKQKNQLDDVEIFCSPKK